MGRGDLRRVEVNINILRREEHYIGYFHEFTTEKEEGEIYTVAIVEDERGNIKTPYVGFVKFID